MLNPCSVVVFQRSIVKWGGHCPWVDVHSAMCETCGVVVFHTCMVNWRRRALVDVYSAICETYVV